jgi:hypothetical protein
MLIVMQIPDPVAVTGALIDGFVGRRGGVNRGFLSRNDSVAPDGGMALFSGNSICARLKENQTTE